MAKTEAHPAIYSQSDWDQLTKRVRDVERREAEVGRAFAIAASRTKLRVRLRGAVTTYALDVYQRAIEETWLGNGSSISAFGGTLVITGPDGQPADAAAFEAYCNGQSALAALAPTLIDYIVELHRLHPEIAAEVIDIDGPATLRIGLRGGGWPSDKATDQHEGYGEKK